MTVARQVVPGRTYLMSRRCTQRQLLLRPDKGVEQIYHYCLGEAAERYGITLNGFLAMGNHQHVIFRDNRGNYPDFVGHLDKMIAKAMNARLGRWENFWSSEPPSIVHLVEGEDRFAKLIYLLSNPVADHLVERVSDWPGASSFSLHLSGRTMTIERPRGFFRPNGPMPETVTLRLERPEGFEALSDREWADLILEAVRAKEQQARAERAEKGGRVLGRKAVLEANPTDTPKSIAPRRQLRPHLACRNKERRRYELRALLEFRDQRRRALERLRDGERDVLFPYGTFRIAGVFATAPPPRIVA